VRRELPIRAGDPYDPDRLLRGQRHLAARLVAPSRLLPFVGGVLVTLLSFPVLFGLAVAAVAVRLAVLARRRRGSPAAPERATPARAAR
jgi:hypothetical protein